jgi:hypothetical protein
MERGGREADGVRLALPTNFARPGVRSATEGVADELALVFAVGGAEVGQAPAH